MDDQTVEKLEKLASLHERGLLSKDEFEAQKAKLLRGAGAAAEDEEIEPVRRSQAAPLMAIAGLLVAGVVGIAAWNAVQDAQQQADRAAQQAMQAQNQASKAERKRVEAEEARAEAEQARKLKEEELEANEMILSDVVHERDALLKPDIRVELSGCYEGVVYCLAANHGAAAGTAIVVGTIAGSTGQTTVQLRPQEIQILEIFPGDIGKKCSCAMVSQEAVAM